MRPERAIRMCILRVAQESTGEAGNDAHKAYGDDSVSMVKHDEGDHEEVEPMRIDVCIGPDGAILMCTHGYVWKCILA